MRKIVIKIDKQVLKQKLDIQNGVTPDISLVALEASKIAETNLKPLIPSPFQFDPAAVFLRDKLETLEGDERLAMSAIKDLKETLESMLKKIDKAVPIYVGGMSSSVSTGGMTVLTPTGTVNGTNTIFVFSSAPSIIVVDQGRQMQKVSSDGTVNWTGTTTIVLAIAPNYDIYAI